MENEQADFGYGDPTHEVYGEEPRLSHESMPRQSVGNIFNKKREQNQEPRQSHPPKQELRSQSKASSKDKKIDIQAELRFEEHSLQLLSAKRWEQLLQLTDNHLHKQNTVHYFAFFYRGVANYKLMQYEDARDDFT